MNDLYLVHSAKGTTWSKNKHKYIRKEGNRYIYADGSASASDPQPKLRSDYEYKNPNDYRTHRYVNDVKRSHQYINDTKYRNDAKRFATSRRTYRSEDVTRLPTGGATLNTHSTYKYVTYGKAHMTKMNIARKLSELTGSDKPMRLALGKKSLMRSHILSVAKRLRKRN